MYEHTLKSRASVTYEQRCDASLDPDQTFTVDFRIRNLLDNRPCRGKFFTNMKSLRYFVFLFVYLYMYFVYLVGCFKIEAMFYYEFFLN